MGPSGLYGLVGNWLLTHPVSSEAMLTPRVSATIENAGVRTPINGFNQRAKAERIKPKTNIDKHMFKTP